MNTATATATEMQNNFGRYLNLVMSGHIYGIAGINGSGKTVLMKCICGLIMPTMGSVHVDGKQVDLIWKKRRKA